MSTISAGTAPGTALVTSGDTTGQLVFQTNGTTTAVTIGTNQVVSLAQPLPVASGGTGSTTGVNLASSVTGTLPVANGGTGVTTSTGSGNNVLSTSPTLVTPNLGTPSAATLTNATGLPLSTGVTGTLPVANGGTGATSLTANNVLLGNGTSAVQVVAPGSSGNILTSNGTTWTSAAPAAAGNWVFVSNNNASSVTSLTISLTGTNQLYVLVFKNLRINGNSNGALEMRFTNLTSSLYSWALLNDVPTSWGGASSQSYGRLAEGRFNNDSGGQPNNGNASGVYYINASPDSSSYPGFWGSTSVVYNLAGPYQSITATQYRSVGATDNSITIQFSNSAAFTGNFTLYRIVNA